MAPAPADFFFQTWETDHGLPQNHSTAIVQTRDGYLWLGTYSGLARFDGVRFVVFSAPTTPGLSSSRITSLWEDGEGTLWLGHDGGELTRMRGEHFEPVPMPAAWSAGAILAIREDAANDLWLLGENGLVFRWRDGATIPPESGPATPSLVRDSRGTLWRVHGGKMQVIGAPAVMPPPVPPPANDYIVRAAVRREGGMWLACGERLRQWGGGAAVDHGAVPWGAGGSVTAMLEGRDGALWVGTLSQGLFVRSRDGVFTQFTRTNGLSHDWVRSLGEDQEGTIWVGTGGGGLCAVRERRVRMVEAPDLWQGRTVLALEAAADGAIWVGTEGAGAYRWRGDAWTRFGEREGLGSLFVWSILEDPRGELWVGTWGGGLFHLVDGRFAHPSGLEAETVPMCALMAARDGSLWVGTQTGLLRLTAGRVERYGQQLARPDVRALAEGADGTIWFGMSGGGLGRWRGGQITQYRRSDGLPSDFVWSLLAEADGTLWLGTFGGGLGRWRDGRCATINQAEGLPNNVICSLVDDGRGQFWMGSYGGILRAAREELNRCADGRLKTAAFFVYGKADGLASLSCSGGHQPSACRLPDGRIWIPTSKGPAAVDPGRMRTNPLAPPVVIEEVSVDGVVLSRPAGAGAATAARSSTGSSPGLLRVPPGRQRFEFRFTALSFVAPERVRFKFRLEGLEQEWVQAGTERVANYSFLPPGDYTFRVVACNSDGVWNEAGAALPLTVLPHVWQTWWFRLATALAAAAAVGGTVRALTRRRYHRKLEQVERQRAVERERARIAKDIHDDLGASLTRITLLSQTARSDLDQPERAAADLDRIYATAHQLTKAMDEIVWAVDPQHDTLDSLVSYLGGFAQDFLSMAGVRCRLDGPMHLDALPVGSEVRHHLFLAFKEAVHNVVQHAAAREVRVVFAPSGAGFALAVQDDGRGFDTSRAPGLGRGGSDKSGPGTGNGLFNMRKRLDHIGGHCEVRSNPGQGTTVTFRLQLGPVVS